MALIEVDGCVYDEEQFAYFNGYARLDPVGREAFVNHTHVSGDDRAEAAERIIQGWSAEMRLRWPGLTFRIYRHVEADEVTIRFHVVRPGVPSWCERGVEVILVNG